MNINSRIFLVWTSLLLIAAPGVLHAQDDDDDRHFYLVSTYQWPFSNLDEIYEMWEEDLELGKQNEFIISETVLNHYVAGPFSLMTITEYASFEDIHKALERGAELYRAKYPNEENREARNKKFAALVGTNIHEDHILRENPKLAK
jgi:hypothetical protein